MKPARTKYQALRCTDPGVRGFLLTFLGVTMWYVVTVLVLSPPPVCVRRHTCRVYVRAQLLRATSLPVLWVWDGRQVHPQLLRNLAGPASVC